MNTEPNNNFMYTNNVFLWVVLGLLLIGILRFFYGLLVIKGQRKNYQNRHEVQWKRLIEPLRRKTQPATVRFWIEEVGFFPIEAAEDYGIKNLSAVVCTLQQRGVPIEPVFDESGKVIFYKKTEA